MKIRTRRLFALFTLLWACITSHAGEEMTPQQLSDLLIGKDVIILGTPAKDPSGRRPDFLSTWYFMSVPGRFSFEPVPATHAGQHAVVVAVTPETTGLNSANSERVDAFGKKLGPSRDDKTVRVVVKVDSGLEINTRGLPSNIIGSRLQLVETVDMQTKEIEAALLTVIGKRLLNTAFTQLLPVDMDVSELFDYNKRRFSRDVTTPSLSPLKVTDARLLPAQKAVVLKVALADGGERLLLGSVDNYFLKRDYKATVLDRLSLNAAESIPSNFTAREISSIKAGTIFRGMNQEALIWAWGFPDKSNDWGLGGKQHLYTGNRFVYVRGKAVQDWQVVN